MTKMTGAQFVAQTLASYGVSHVFFVPAILTEALPEMEKVGVRPVMAHAEKAAAYMADGYARTKRGPGVCLGQSVGAANLAAGLQDAYLGNSPVVAITGHRPPEWRHRHSYQEIDHRPLYDPVTKFNVDVETVEQLPVLLRQAFREAVSGNPGPAHLDLSGIRGEDVMNAEADLELIPEPRFRQYPPFRPRPDPEDIASVARLLAGAHRPAIVAGGGVSASQAGHELVRLAEMMSIPVAYGLNAKGQMPDDHPLCVGVLGSYSRWCANRMVAEADTVLFVGSHTGSQVTHDWKVPRRGAKVAQIDIDPAELGRSYPNSACALGDARESLRALIDALEPVQSRPEWLGRVNELVSGWQDEFHEYWESDASPMRPERICSEVSGSLPSNGVVVADTGHNAMWAGMYLDINHPEQRFIRCAGSLGWAFPAAIGAKCAAPERPVVCFTGDGGLWYHFTELETAVNQGIPVVVVVNDNRSLNQTRRGVERGYGGDRGAQDGSAHPERMWKFTDVDFARLAQDLGAFGVRVERSAELGPAIEAAIDSGRPAIVDAVSDIDAMAPLAWG